MIVLTYARRKRAVVIIIAIILLTITVLSVLFFPYGRMRLIAKVFFLKEELILEPNNPFARQELAQVYALLGRYDDSVGQYKEYLRQFPQDDIERMLYAQTLNDAGMYQEAIVQYEMLLKGNQSRTVESSWIHKGCAIAYEGLGNIDAAIDQLREVDQYLHDPFMRLWISGLYVKDNRLDEAITELQEAINLDDSNAIYYYRLGEVFKMKGCKKEAEMAFQRYIELPYVEGWPEIGEVQRIIQEMEDDHNHE